MANATGPALLEARALTIIFFNRQTQCPTAERVPISSSTGRCSKWNGGPRASIAPPPPRSPPPPPPPPPPAGPGPRSVKCYGPAQVRSGTDCVITKCSFSFHERNQPAEGRKGDRTGERTDVRPYVRTSVRTAARPYVRTSIRPHVRTSACPHVRMSGRPYERRTDERTDERKNERTKERLGERNNERTNERMDERANERMNEQRDWREISRSCADCCECSPVGRIASPSRSRTVCRSLRSTASLAS